MNIDSGDYPYYVSDIRREEMLYACFLRSHITEGRIQSVKIPQLPKNVSVFSAKDFGKKNFITVNNLKIPLLADKEIRYRGEPILLITAPSRETLKSVCESVEIEYKEKEMLESIFSDLNGKTVIYKTSCSQSAAGEQEDEEDPEVISSFNTPVQEHFYPDSQGVFIEYGPSSKLKVIVSSEWPKHVKQTVMNITELPSEKVFVMLAKSSPTFDGKIWQPSILAAVASFAAINLKKSIKLVLSKKEDILYSGKRAPALFFIDACIGDSMKLHFLNFSFTYYCGAYFPFAKEMIETTAFGAKYFYNARSIKIRGEACVSNTPPTDFFSGISLPQFFFAAEMFINRLAKQKEVSPLELRLANINHAFFRSINYEKKDIFPILLAELNNRCDFTRKHAAYEHMRKRGGTSFPGSVIRGIGLSTAFQANGLNMHRGRFNQSVRMSLTPENIVKVNVSSIPNSKRTRQIWKESVSEILNLPIRNVTISYSFSDETVSNGPTLLSGNISTINRLIKLCAEEIRSKAQTHGREQTITVEKVSSDLLSRNKKKFLYTSVTCAAAVAEISLRFLTMELIIDKITVILDCGYINNEAVARQKIETAVIQSILWVTRDESYQNLINESLFYYPGIDRLPEIEIIFRSSENGFEKGIGEIAYSLIPAALLTAVGQAVNKDLKEIPIENEKIFNLGEVDK